MAELHDVLIRPILTEKTTQLESAGNVYAFEVGEGANKHQREGFHGEPPRDLLRICRILHNLVFV